MFLSSQTRTSSVLGKGADDKTMFMYVSLVNNQRQKGTPKGDTTRLFAVDVNGQIDQTEKAEHPKIAPVSTLVGRAFHIRQREGVLRSGRLTC